MPYVHTTPDMFDRIEHHVERIIDAPSLDALHARLESAREELTSVASCQPHLFANAWHEAEDAARHHGLPAYTDEPGEGFPADVWSWDATRWLRRELGAVTYILEPRPEVAP